MTGAEPGAVTAAIEAARGLFELPEELVIDTAGARRTIVEFIRGQLRQAGFERALMGLSGGIDSAVVAHLVADAVGPERLLCLMMPYRTSAPESQRDAEAVIGRLGCASRVVDISPMVDAYFGTADAAGAEGGSAGILGAEGSAASALRRGNLMARVRMSALYDFSVAWGGLVVGTGNKTESLLGYTTIFGDSACAFSPVGDLYKSQLRQLALDLGVPRAIIAKAPSADLWPGQTDEGEVGFSYADVDRLLYWMVDRRLTRDELVGRGFEEGFVDRVSRIVAGSEFKRQVPPIAKLGPPTSGLDHLYPRRRPPSSEG
jgi:NAD+ synthase